jgi:hypothetical protein
MIARESPQFAIVSWSPLSTATHAVEPPLYCILISSLSTVSKADLSASGRSVEYIDSLDTANGNRAARYFEDHAPLCPSNTPYIAGYATNRSSCAFRYFPFFMHTPNSSDPYVVSVSSHSCGRVRFCRFGHDPFISDISRLRCSRLYFGVETGALIFIFIKL